MYACHFYNSHKTYLPSDFLPKEFQNDTCYKNYVDFHFYVKNYEKLKDTIWANKAIALFNSTDLHCNKKYDLLYWRFYLYILMKDYNNGIEYFNSLEKEFFVPEYHKTYFINTLKSIIYNNKNNTITRNELNKQIVLEIENYLKTIYVDGVQINVNLQDNLKKLLYKYSISHKQTIFDYYVVRARYENIDLIINELKNANKNIYNAEIDYWKNNVLPDILSTLDSMKLKTNYHFEY
jgi:hypothetical protein